MCHVGTQKGIDFGPVWISDFQISNTQPVLYLRVTFLLSTSSPRLKVYAAKTLHKRTDQLSEYSTMLQWNGNEGGEKGT